MTGAVVITVEWWGVVGLGLALVAIAMLVRTAYRWGKEDGEADERERRLRQDVEEADARWRKT